MESILLPPPASFSHIQACFIKHLHYAKHVKPELICLKSVLWPGFAIHFVYMHNTKSLL